MRLCAVSVAVLVLAAGCGGDESDDEAAPARWGGPPRLVADEPQLDVDAFNSHAAASDEPWERSPLLAAAEYLRIDRAEASSIGLSAKGPGEGRGRTQVVASLEGLLDDSIEAIRYALVFEPKADGTWRLAEASWSQRCRAGRGHHDFSSAACV